MVVVWTIAHYHINFSKHKIGASIRLSHTKIVVFPRRKKNRYFYKWFSIVTIQEKTQFQLF
jgi:hypothetical protein